MFFTKKKTKSPPRRRAQHKVPPAKSSGLDAFIRKMEKVLADLDEKGGKTIHVDRDYWQGMVDRLKTIKEKL